MNAAGAIFAIGIILALAGTVMSFTSRRVDAQPTLQRAIEHKDRAIAQYQQLVDTLRQTEASQKAIIETMTRTQATMQQIIDTQAETIVLLQKRVDGR